MDYDGRRGDGMRRVRSRSLDHEPTTREPQSRLCPHCGGMVRRYRADDLDLVLDRFVWTCCLCARLYCVTSSSQLEFWVVPMVIAS